MKIFSLPVFLLVFLIIAAGGCTGTPPETAPAPATGIPEPQVPSAAPTPVPQDTVTAPPADPLIGIWRGYNNLPAGRIERVWIFRENGTWTMTNTNVKSQKKKVISGRWLRENDGSYQILPPDGAPDTFTYDTVNDRLSDSYFRETYSRIFTLQDAQKEPTMNVTVHSARRASSIGGSHPYPGNRYLVVNLTIKNVNESGWYQFSDGNIWVVPDGGTGSASLNQKSGDILENLFPAARIPVGEERQGIVIFGVPEQSESFTLNLFNNLGETVSNVVELKNVPTGDE